ncbi:uncharacterized protein LOC116344320 [Contarinia nasturtii]|uniref:uncharacterized protein LOC116344320 n=1 Tax=Contarinia nasturtii TaxID=265458 RepID=UPI0012D4BFDE|nr:uncharacterized protein LOC116344320 [Contarinia nasturtii]
MLFFRNIFVVILIVLAVATFPINAGENGQGTGASTSRGGKQQMDITDQIKLRDAEKTVKTLTAKKVAKEKIVKDRQKQLKKYEKKVKKLQEKLDKLNAKLEDAMK